MSVPRPAARSHPILFMFIGLAILAASAGVFLLILGSVFGRYELADLAPSRTNLLAVFSSPRMAILESRYSDQILPEGSTWLHDNVSAWKRFLHANNAEFDVLDDRAVESDRLKEYGLLILPGSRSLSDREIESIKRFIDEGGSVFATGGTATFTENGEWRGWDFISQVFGLQYTREITPDQATKSHTLRGGLPITSGIPTGFSLKVATWDNPIACKVVEPRTTQASTWYNFGSDSGLTRESIESTAGIAYGTYGRGRFVWMGFELNSVLGNQNDYVYFDIMCRRCVDWLTGVPTALVRDWPAGYTAAAMVALPVATDSIDAGMFLASCAKNRIPVTAFVQPGLLKNSSLLKEFLSCGEIGALLENGTPDNTTTAPGLVVSGAYTPSGSRTETDLLPIRTSGYQYVVEDSISDRAVPETIVKDRQALVLFTKTARGDDEVIKSYGLRDTALQLFTYREDVDRVLFQGGLYLLQIHLDLQGRAEFAPVMNDLSAYLNEKKIWAATGTALSRWWVARSALEVSVQTRSKRRIALVVSNASANEIDGAVIQLNINKPASNIALTSDILGTIIPAFRYNPKIQVVEITIPVLEGNSSISLFVDFDQPSV